MWQRQGVAQSLNAHTPRGLYIELRYHHGLHTWGVEEYHKSPCTAPKTRGWPDIVTSRHVWLKADTFEEAFEEASAKWGIPARVEAYCYSNAKTLELWPHVATDTYITSATYEPSTDTIRHEPSNVCLIRFDDEGKGEQFWDGAARKYTAEIAKALEPFNGNVKAHGQGQERKEWLAWLLGQYIRELRGERPVERQSIARRTA